MRKAIENGELSIIKYLEKYCYEPSNKEEEIL